MFNFHATGGLTAEKIACVAVSSMQNLLALAAIKLQSCQYFSMKLGTKICESQNGGTE